MAVFPDKDWSAETHRRLLSGDPTASAEIYKAVYSPLIGWLHAKGRTPDMEQIHDAATRALVDYLKRPDSWRAERGTLVAYLCMAADRDLLNILKTNQLRAKREVLAADVEDAVLAGNVSAEEPAAEDTDDGLLAQLDRQVTTGTDRRLVDLMLRGERSTDKFAQVLGIQDQAKFEKARIVKQHKDRLKKVLERLRNRLDAS